MVHRSSLSSRMEDRVVASSRSGSRLSAAVLGNSHVALAYVASRKTTEGWVNEAWMEVDESAPQRISDDGSGATSVSLAPRGPGVLAILIDARTALTAMHARPVTYEGGRLGMGEDVVVFVGSPGDRRTVASVAAVAGGPVWSLLPIAKDAQTFGLALTRIHEPPRVEEPVVWSIYPNGLDAPPVAVDVSRNRIWAARVRPAASAPGSPEVLELGDVSEEGDFDSRDVRPTIGSVSHVTLAADEVGTLWIHWVDGSGSWLERLACK